MSKQDESVGTDTDDNAGNFLRGGDAIRRYLVSLGLPEDVDVYYLKRSGWPIGSSGGGRGGFLLATKRRLVRHLERLANATSPKDRSD